MPENYTEIGAVKRLKCDLFYHNTSKRCTTKLFYGIVIDFHKLLCFNKVQVFFFFFMDDYYHVKFHFSFEPPLFLRFRRLPSETEEDVSFAAKLTE